MHSKLSSTLLLITLGALSASASAHTGTDLHAHMDLGFFDGLLHPLTGLDHLAAMLAVGVWSALSARRLWTAPLSFAALLLVGALLAQAGWVLPAVEAMVAASLLVLGLMVALRARLGAVLSSALVGIFALFHGMAHGIELNQATQAWAPLLGMMIATLALHAAGVGLGLALRHGKRWGPQAAGAAVTLLGGVLLMTVA